MTKAEHSVFWLMLLMDKLKVKSYGAFGIDELQAFVERHIHEECE